MGTIDNGVTRLCLLSASSWRADFCGPVNFEILHVKHSTGDFCISQVQHSHLSVIRILDISDMITVNLHEHSSETSECVIYMKLTHDVLNVKAMR